MQKNATAVILRQLFASKDVLINIRYYCPSLRKKFIKFKETLTITTEVCRKESGTLSYQIFVKYY